MNLNLLLPQYGVLLEFYKTAASQTATLASLQTNRLIRWKHQVAP